MNEDKKTRKAPAFQFYADDFLAGTLEMSQEEVGQYIRLLCHQWNRGSIPVETEKQQRLTGGCVSVDVLVKFRLCEDGLLRNERLETVRSEKDRYLQQQSQKGRKSAELRKLALTVVQPDTQPESNSGSTTVEIRLQPKVNSPSPTPTPNNKEESIAPKSQRSHFTVPTVEEVQAECVRIELAVLEAPKFVNYYESKGWVVGKTKMKSWKSALIGWKNRQIEFQQQRDRQQSLSIAAHSKTVLSENIADYL
jgi:uncharacterized protein YdaU (DUF1376 family)